MGLEIWTYMPSLLKEGFGVVVVVVVWGAVEILDTNKVKSTLPW